jgi:hypothetical protein
MPLLFLHTVLFHPCISYFSWPFLDIGAPVVLVSGIIGKTVGVVGVNVELSVGGSRGSNWVGVSGSSGSSSSGGVSGCTSHSSKGGSCFVGTGHRTVTG